MTDTATLAHLLKYDSVHGRFDETVTTSEDGIVVNVQNIELSAEREPRNLPWSELGVEIVLELTGFFFDKAGVRQQLEAGAKKW